MRPLGRTTLFVQRLLARTGRGAFRSPWAAAYLLVATLVGRRLAGGTRHASVYLRGSVGSPDFLPAVSDLDLAIVLDDASGPTSRPHERLQRLERWLPGLGHAVDKPRVTTVSELRDLLGVTVYTDGLDRPSPPVSTFDRRRYLDRPGLYGALGDWRPLAGRERRPPEPRRDDHQVRLACWLELLFYWKHGLESLAAPPAPHTAALCVKLVSEPARVLLWLSARERPRSRIEALERVADVLPDAECVGAVIELARQLQRAPEPDFALVLPLLVRLSAEIAGELERQVAEEGTTTVRLVGSTDRVGFPLCDWRELTRGGGHDGWFTLGDGTPGDVTTLMRAMVDQAGDRYQALATPGLLHFPSVLRERMALRAVACRVTDPVSFALVAGNGDAVFPDVPGWSALDWSRRAVAEHARRLPTAARAGEVLAAARAALFRESVANGDPALTLTLDATADALDERMPSLGPALRAAREGDRGALEALRAGVGALPAFAGPRDASAQDTAGAYASSAILRSTAGRPAITSSSH